MCPQPIQCGVGSPRRALEELLRDRVKHARQRYIEKAVISEALAAEFLQLGLEPDPTGRLAFRRILWLESQALRTYMQTVRMYAELMVHGILPPDAVTCAEDSAVRSTGSTRNH